MEDIDYFIEKIEEAHAEPYRVISKEEFKKLAARLKEYTLTLREDRISPWESYYILAELAAAIQDEHTLIGAPYHLLPETELYFPFKIKVMEEKIYIARNLGDTAIPELSELLEINGISVRTIREKCIKYQNFPLPHAKARTFEQAVNIFLTTVFDMHSPWKIKYISDDSVKEAAAEGVSGNILLKALTGPAAYSEKKLTVAGKEIPVLDIPSFAYGSFENYQQFIDDVFARHKNKEALIIDLRQNPGGNGVWGYYMMDYIAEFPYKTREEFIFKVSEVFKKSGYRSKAGDRWKEAKNGTYIPISSNNIRSPQPEAKRFTGRAFLLVSDSTNSAGVVTAAIFKYNKMGTVIGQETKGRLKFNSDPVTVRLPRTQFSLQIPVAIYALPGDIPDRGVIPDIITSYSLEDIRKGLDKEMEKVKEILSKSF